jgi:lipopolysaccharide/colanic/teichoic acid biosynthesis glycosyltransferase
MRVQGGDQGRRDVVKRAFDLIVAALLLLLLSPLIVTTALLVLVFLGTPVLFRQRRPGREGRPFTICKFRTMRDLRDADGLVLGDADRLTRLGRFLRRTSLDELPELWNVLRGEMSLVGPRPLLMEYLPRYSPEQRRRHQVRPGITGWTQVNGRNALTWDEKLRLDVWYVDHRSMWLDFKILLRTVATVVTREGITAPGAATMPPFEGSAEPNSTVDVGEHR